jgi:hypothetical protein
VRLLGGASGDDVQFEEFRRNGLQLSAAGSTFAA